MNIAILTIPSATGVYTQKKAVDKELIDLQKEMNFMSTVHCECGHTYHMRYDLVCEIYGQKHYEHKDCPKCGAFTKVLYNYIYVYTEDLTDKDNIKEIAIRMMLESDISSCWGLNNIKNNTDITSRKNIVGSVIERDKKIELNQMCYNNVAASITREENNIITDLKYDIEKLQFVFDLNADYKDRSKLYENGKQININKANLKKFILKANPCDISMIEFPAAKKDSIVRYYMGSGVLYSTLIKRLMSMSTAMETIFKLDLMDKFNVPSFIEGQHRSDNIYEFLRLDKSSFKAISILLSDEDCVLRIESLRRIFEAFDHNNAMKICNNIKSISDFDYRYPLDCFIDLLKIGYNVEILTSYLNNLMPTQGIDITSGVKTLRDYVNMCEELRLRKYERYPKSLKLYHDLMVLRFNLKKDQIADRKISEIVKRHEFLDNISDSKYIVLLAKTVNDLIQEGADLCHCVGSYGKKVSEGRSVILFMREKSNIDKALLTIELDPEDDYKIVQAKGLANRDATEEELVFIKGTLIPTINNTIKNNKISCCC